MCGAVLLTASGLRKGAQDEPLPESLAIVRTEPPPHPWAPVLEAVRATGWLLPALIAFAVLVAAAGTVVEVLLFRGLFDLPRHLTLTGQRLGAMGFVIVWLGGRLALEWPASHGLLRLGRQLELRLRARFLMKIPRLSDRYFRSRLISDMAFRAHTLPPVAPACPGSSLDSSDFREPGLYGSRDLVAVSRAPPGPAWIAVAIAVGVPLLFQPALIERDLRCREIGTALTRFYLDALLGSRAIQAHRAERTLRAAQAPQLERWADAGLRQQALLVRAETAQMVLSVAAIIWLVYRQSALTQGSAGLLLLVYWALSIPAGGRQLASVVWNLPALRNTLLRFLEPLGAPEQEIEGAPAAPSTSGGVRVSIEHATVVAGGHVLLDRVTLEIAPCEHVAVVGLSGSGKSSLVGLLLGWHAPTEGRPCGH